MNIPYAVKMIRLRKLITIRKCFRVVRYEYGYNAIPFLNRILQILAVAVLLTACSSPTSAPNGDLEVLVQNVMQQPISEATVVIEPGSLSQTSDEFGKVIFKDLSVGEYSVQVTSLIFETYTNTATVSDGKSTSLTAILTGKPASLDMTVRASGTPMIGVTVRILRQFDDTEIYQGITDQDGRVLAEGLVAQPVTVLTDTLDNLRSDLVQVQLVGLATEYLTIDLQAWSSMFIGNFSFGNSDPHYALLLKVSSDGSTITELGTKALFAGQYRLLTAELARIHAIQFGNTSPFEMAVVFSPPHYVTAYNTYYIPTQNSVITLASPRDDVSFYTADLPIPLRCDYPTASCVFNEWEVDYWRYESGEWNWETIQVYESPQPVTQWAWDGSIASTSPFYGQPLMASAEGEYYSWYVVAGYSNGMLSFSPDYFFKLLSPPSSGAKLVMRSRIGPAELAALKRRLDETRLERMEAVLERVGLIQPIL